MMSSDGKELYTYTPILKSRKKTLDSSFGDITRDKHMIYFNGTPLSELLIKMPGPEDEKTKIRKIIIQQFFQSAKKNSRNNKCTEFITNALHQESPGYMAANELAAHMMISGVYVPKETKRSHHYALSEDGGIEVISKAEIPEALPMAGGMIDGGEVIKNDNGVALASLWGKTKASFYKNEIRFKAPSYLIKYNNAEIERALKKDDATVATEDTGYISRFLNDESDKATLIKIEPILKKYEQYLMQRYGSTPDNPFSKHGIIQAIIKKIDYNNPTESLKAISDAINTHKKTLSAHQTPGEIGLLQTIKKILAYAGLWKSQGQKKVAEIENITRQFKQKIHEIKSNEPTTTTDVPHKTM